MAVIDWSHEALDGALRCAEKAEMALAGFSTTEEVPVEVIKARAAAASAYSELGQLYLGLYRALPDVD